MGAGNDIAETSRFQARRIGVLLLQHMLRMGLPAFAIWLGSSAQVAAQQSGEKPVFDTVIVRSQPAEAARPNPLPPPAVAQPDKAEDSGGASTAAGAQTSKASGRRDPYDPAIVRGVRVEAAGRETRFRMQLSAGVRAEIFTLANPYRVIVDLPDVAFELADGTGRSGAGLVTAFRFGLFAERKARVVIDATGPVKIQSAKMAATGKGRAVELVLELTSIAAEEFGSGTGAGALPPVSKPAVYEDPVPPKAVSATPLVLIDPGHGGIDPGALGDANVLEKTIVLGVAQKLKRRLDQTGRFRVELTRSSDIFVSLDQRLKRSRDLGADLFISLHADSIAAKEYAAVVRGATVYTLSERASDEQARLMAEKENASDRLAGLDTTAIEDGGEEVRGILIDLIKRETANFSTDFSNILIGKLKAQISLSREPQRSAAFKVLKQTHAPSVLVELGYMSNETDAKLMGQAEWQGKVAQSIMSAVDAFFDKRTARTLP